MGFGKRGSSKRKRGGTDISKLDKKQISHLRQFGEAHPADCDDSDGKKEKYQKIDDIDDHEKEVDKQEKEIENSSESEEELTDYQKLVSSLKGSISKVPESDEESEDDEESEEDEEAEGEEELKLEDINFDDLPKELQDKLDASSDEDEDNGAPEDDDLETNEAGGDKHEDGDDEGEDAEEDEDDELAEDKGEDYRTETMDDNEASNFFDTGYKKEDDPFTQHFEHDIPEALVESLEDKQPFEKSPFKAPILGQCVLYQPGGTDKKIPTFHEKDVRKQHVRLKLCNQLRRVNQAYGGVSISKEEKLSQLQLSLFSIIHNYQDLFLPHRDHKNGEEIRLVYCMHALNHILKTRDRVTSHNTKLKLDRARKISVKKEKGKKKNEIKPLDEEEEFRDQGLTRPKVLMILPFRDSAVKVVNMLTNLLEKETLVEKKKRFKDEFTEQIETERKGMKPEDFDAVFTGNTDDHFKLGIGISKKSVRLYTPFYSSDIILASPLGLRTAIGAEGDKNRDSDFLSSIEILILDQTDIFLMQNWDNILHIMSHMNLQPKESHGVDFSRVRMWTVNGWSRFYRQTLLFSSVSSPEINSLFNKSCTNYSGKILVPRIYDTGSISRIVTQLPQVFQRIHCTSFLQASEARFKHFIEKVLPQYKDATMNQTLVIIPSYFDFVKIRNYMKRTNIKFVQLCEYSKKIVHSRRRFKRGKVQFMLFTERLHFYRRFRLRGIKHLIFYGLPIYPHFYSEICNMPHDASRPDQHTDNITCTILYTKYDAQKLAAVVGNERATHMINSDKEVHMFVTG